MKPTTANKLKIFTWHIHGSYLFYLSKGRYTIYIPVKADKRDGYYGRGNTFPFGDNVIEVPAEEVKHLSFDCILYQSDRNYLHDQYDILSAEQRKLPAIYLEHNAPDPSPVNSIHPLFESAITLVHVTHYNCLMWNNRVPNTRVIQHGIPESPVEYNGDMAKGLVLINHIRERGRYTGWDIVNDLRKRIPIDIVGMGTEKYGGLGEVLHPHLPEFMAQYRFFLNPIRHTSFGLSVCEAMMMGMPIVSLATSEYASILRHGQSGYVHNNIVMLEKGMEKLLESQVLATEMGREAQIIAREEFSLDRFTNEWEQLFQKVVQQKSNYYESNSIY